MVNRTGYYIRDTRIIFTYRRVPVTHNKISKLIIIFSQVDFLIRFFVDVLLINIFLFRGSGSIESVKFSMGIILLRTSKFSLNTMNSGGSKLDKITYLFLT